ncbi:MAG: threonine/serine dehydratase [Planctomycetota bacterium]|nr:MAG: threonine/serine dehydratase [Planctomycetota bacterium]
MDVRAEVLAAEVRIAGHVRRTPVESSHFLGAAGKCHAYLKLENFQRTGSFKFRGAMNKLLALAPAERKAGIVAASTGNHGVAVACAADLLGVPAVIFAPETARSTKLEAVRDYGAEVRQVGDDCLVTESAARAHARDESMTFSPYNDPEVIAGQGTIGRELEQQLENVDTLFVAVGGGGFVSGIGGYLKAVGRDVRVVACSPRRSAVMHDSLAAGQILDLPSEPTLSDGTAGGVEEGAITFDLCRDVIDDFVLVDEDEIADAVRSIVVHHHMLVEGAAGVAVAAFQKEREGLEGQDVVVVLCGANMDVETLKGLL